MSFFDRCTWAIDGWLLHARSVPLARDPLGPARPAVDDRVGLLTHARLTSCHHSLFNGHPLFLGYITSSAAPIGALGDLLAAAVNPNVGAWQLSPIASEIEGQCIRWLAGLLGMPAGSEGLLVSGGNMANFVCFLAARRAKAGEGVREAGVHRDGPRLLAYASTETHTWTTRSCSSATRAR